MLLLFSISFIVWLAEWIQLEEMYIVVGLGMAGAGGLNVWLPTEFGRSGPASASPGRPAQIGPHIPIEYGSSLSMFSIPISFAYVSHSSYCPSVELDKWTVKRELWRCRGLK
jgi:hypothetical protein